MSKRLSKIYGLDIYSSDGVRIGKVEEVLLNLEEGMVMSLYKSPISKSLKNPPELRRILMEEGISFSDVVSIGDIVLANVKGKSGKQKRRGVESEEIDYAL